MTIRKTLLRAFLLIGLAPALLLALLAFFTAREAMQSEIANNLTSQADSIASEINKVMFERLQNAATWSTLEVMQDLQVRDVDERISNFLAKLKTGYGGVYLDLYAFDRDGHVVSSSNPADIGRTRQPYTPWQTANLANTTLSLEFPQQIASNYVFRIHAPISSQFNGSALGELMLNFDGNQINALLDADAGDERMIAVVDTAGRIFAASHKLRDAGLLSGGTLGNWKLATQPRNAYVRNGLPIINKDVVVGIAHAHGFAGFSGGGLTTVVIEPESTALAPAHRLAAISFAILLGLIFVTLVAASQISGAIARPIAALTHSTRQYKLGQRNPDLPAAMSGEVGELRSAFAQMIQEIDQAQRDLVRASKLAMIGEMSSIIIHEVRTPLGIMRSSAQMLKREPGLSVESKELIGFIESETDRLNRLVSAMLDSARPRALNMVATDVHRLIHQTGAMLSAQLDKSKLRVLENFTAANPIVDCDPEQLTQVLLNLILNAVQILRVGGKILISTCTEKDWFCIDIEDDGPGIPLEERSHVFEAFFFRREGGVGLGLAIVRQIILAHDGKIEAAESQFGGARFTIRLPLQWNPEMSSSQ